jgi:hypothetical protein
VAIETIPIFGRRAAFEYNIVIDSVSYRLAFTWINRHGSWYLDILENDSTPIRTGIRVILGWPLTLRDAANDLLFDGVLILQRTDDKTREPTLEDFGGAVELVLVTDPDIPSVPSTTRAVIVEAV